VDRVDKTKNNIGFSIGRLMAVDEAATIRLSQEKLMISSGKKTSNPNHVDMQQRFSYIGHIKREY